MSVRYTAVGWSRHKLVYDSIVVGAAVAFILSFVVISKVTFPGAHGVSDEVLVLRALGTCGFTLLTITLSIGPLCRLSPRFLPVLSNRRHLGVIVFLIALVHGGFATVYYHGFGNVNPLVSLLSANTQFNSIASFPYQLLGLAALVVLFLMAATSHDYWVKNLTQRWWKRLHMMVYLAYALLVAHVALGSLQVERNLLLPVTLATGLLCLAGLHIAAGIVERRKDRGYPQGGSPWIDAGLADTIPEGRARTIATSGGERIAVFRHQSALSAVANVCPHQGGPLGEGKVIDGCITCPWHGWQIRPHDGCSPPPFAERIQTYRVRVTAGRVEVNVQALAPGAATEPVPLRRQLQESTRG